MKPKLTRKLKPSAVRKRQALSQHDHTFELIMQRFDQVDKDNAACLTQIAEHTQADAEVHKKVERHSTYWGLLLKIVGVLFLASVTLLFTYFR